MGERLVVHRVGTRLLQVLLRSSGRTRRDRVPAPGPVRFLVLDAGEQGGSVRSNLLLAQHLSQHQPVEVISVLALSAEPFYPLPPGVRCRVLDDRRPGVRRGPVQRLLSRLPSILMHPDDRARSLYSLWTDLRLATALRALDDGWLVTTRIGLTLIAARVARPGVVVVGRDHDNYTHLSAAARTDLRRHASGLDALSVLSRADQRDYSALLAGTGTRVFQLPNALQPLDGDPLRVREKVVMAAGRLVPQKGFDLLVAAFVPVAAQHPDWSLRIFGDGKNRQALQAQVDDLGLTDRVTLLPATRQVGEQMARAGMFVLSSRYEGFGRVLIEAMSKALPVVSFDCPRGPSDILTDGKDGVLVPAEDVAALSQAVLTLIEDEPLRRRLGQAGIRTAGAYDLDAIGERWWEELQALTAGCAAAPGRTA